MSGVYNLLEGASFGGSDGMVKVGGKRHHRFGVGRTMGGQMPESNPSVTEMGGRRRRRRGGQTMTEKVAGKRRGGQMETEKGGKRRRRRGGQDTVKAGKRHRKGRGYY